jgi:hypothetical protein
VRGGDVSPVSRPFRRGTGPASAVSSARLPMRSRHAVLYDVARWRRWRTWLLLPATISLLVTVLTPLLRPGAAGSTSLYTTFYAVAASLWTRQRFAAVGVDGDALVVQVLAGKQRIPLSEVRSVRVMRLGSKFPTAQRRRVLPHPAKEWVDREAVVVRLESDPKVLIRIARLLGPRCVDGRDLVVPVADPERLVEEIAAARPAVVPAARGRRRR